MGFYFIQVDCWRRHTKLLESKAGQFWIGGGAAMFAYWLIWPFDVIKSLAQAETAKGGATNRMRVSYILREYGIFGIYRGMLAGSQSIFLRNGAAMIILQQAHKQFTKMGLRD